MGLFQSIIRTVSTVRTSFQGRYNPRVEATIEFDDEGFRLHGPQIDTRVRWVDITKVSVYKVDMWVYDDICLGIHTHGSSEWIEISEDVKGWTGFSAELERRYSIADGWFQAVALPAFATNHTVLFERSRIDRATN